MQVIETELPDVKLLEPRRWRDPRGFLSEVFNERTLADAGISFHVAQENHSVSQQRGTVRGLHFQLPPRAQAKLVRVARGAVLDVAVDLRHSSPTFGRHVATMLSAENWRQLLVPIGFAHGFCTLEPDTEVVYLLSDVYAPDHERGIRWDDPELAIDWPVDARQALVSERDLALPSLAELMDAVFP